ncbi:predicted protein [Chaetomium globosum CBS 148.51]|uniref:Uncharacterized protein n=1 Tax=Chaetomium globosum (strain ATCC 6205 / CBS 148.51 / DSM 1962 / NBRC 6347 / NRRL 1970) TaxID=306901 RepID=Q2HH87_CHAGB|nr:uncharacterized protein CHGG_00417 [Chaetomium globosum CBS 148.51]EAQ92182.1 predicted protein [Chaetomium globosum CBS 148.51]
MDDVCRLSTRISCRVPKVGQRKVCLSRPPRHVPPSVGGCAEAIQTSWKMEPAMEPDDGAEQLVRRSQRLGNDKDPRP